MTPEQDSQRVTDSPAPAGPRGRWVVRAALPIPRSEMAWATAAIGRMHVLVMDCVAKLLANPDFNNALAGLLSQPDREPLVRARLQQITVRAKRLDLA